MKASILKRPYLKSSALYLHPCVPQKAPLFSVTGFALCQSFSCFKTASLQKLRFFSHGLRPIYMSSYKYVHKWPFCLWTYMPFSVYREHYIIYHWENKDWRRVFVADSVFYSMLYIVLLMHESTVSRHLKTAFI